VEAFLVSTMLVGLAEIGDKTQILSLMLAARFLRPLPIIFGIFFATIPNHAAAGLAGTLFGSLLTGPMDAMDFRPLVPERRRLGAVSGQIRGQ
jgi:Ca2+/H+ antiporter, TMEM165/GDT1 family